MKRGSNASGVVPATETVCTVQLDCEPKTLLMGLAGDQDDSLFASRRRVANSDLAVLRLEGGDARFARVGAPTPGGKQGPGLRLLEQDGKTEWKAGHPYPLPRKGARFILVEALRASPKRGYTIPVEFLDADHGCVCQTHATVKVIDAEIHFDSALVGRTGKLLCSATLPVSARGRGLNEKDFNFGWTFPRGSFDKPMSMRPTLTGASDKTPVAGRDLVVLEVSLKKNPACKVRLSRPLNITTPDSVTFKGNPQRQRNTQLNINNFSSANKRSGNRQLFNFLVRYVIVDQFGADINDSYGGRNGRVVKIREQVEGNLRVFLPNNTGNDIRVSNAPRYKKPSPAGRINDRLQATFAKANLVKVEANRVSFAIATKGSDYLTLKPHPWFVAIGGPGDAVLNPDQVTDNDLRCFVESVRDSGRRLNIRTTYGIKTV